MKKRYATFVLYLAVILAILSAGYTEIVKRAIRHELGYSVTNENVYLSDFALFHTAGKMVLTNQGPSVYDAKAFNKNLPVETQQCDLILLSTPIFLPLITPVAFFSLHTAFNLWIILSIIALLAASYLILNGRRDFKIASILLITVCILASQPAWFTLLTGHACFFQYLMIAVFFSALFARKDLPAALALALTSFKPQFAIPLVVPALVKQRFKMIALSAFSELLLVALSIITIGPETTWKGPLSVLSWDHRHTEIIPRMICIRSILDAVASHEIAESIAWLAFAGWLCFTYIIWRSSKNIEQEAIAAAITIVGSIVFSPHVHVYDALLMGLAVCFVWPKAGFGAFKRTAGLTKIALWSLIAAYPLLTWYFFIYIGIANDFAGFPFAWLNLVMLVLLVSIFYEKSNSSGIEIEALHNSPDRLDDIAEVTRFKVRQHLRAKLIVWP